MTGHSTISDHAVLRYLERVHGLDVESIRSAMAQACARGVAAGAPSIRIDNTRFINREGNIVTVITTGMVLHYDFLVRVQGE